MSEHLPTIYSLNGMRVTKEEFEEVMAMTVAEREKYLGVRRCHHCGQIVPPPENTNG